MGIPAALINYLCSYCNYKRSSGGAGRKPPASCEGLPELAGGFRSLTPLMLFEKCFVDPMAWLRIFSRDPVGIGTDLDRAVVHCHPTSLTGAARPKRAG